MAPAGRQGGDQDPHFPDEGTHPGTLVGCLTQQEAVAGGLRPLFPPTRWHPGTRSPVREMGCCLTVSGAVPRDLLVKNAPARCRLLLAPVTKLAGVYYCGSEYCHLMWWLCPKLMPKK